MFSRQRNRFVACTAHASRALGIIIWLVSPRRDSLFDLSTRLADSYRELFEASNISFRTGNLEALKLVRLGMEFRQHVFLLLKEAMNNALKHVECGEIVLDVSLRGRRLRIELWDDGKGLDPSSAMRSNGLANMSRRTKAAGGSLHIASEPDRFTRITFEGRIRTG